MTTRRRIAIGAMWDLGTPCRSTREVNTVTTNTTIAGLMDMTITKAAVIEVPTIDDTWQRGLWQDLAPQPF